MGPYLFGLFIISLQPILSSTDMVKYVDDVSLVAPLRKLSSSSVFTDLNGIQSEVTNISHWSSVNNLTLNTAKTTGLICSHGSFKETYNIESFLDNICFKPSVRFLGVVE